MRVFDETKTKELSEYNPELGKLVEDVLVTHIAAQAEVQQVSHYVLIREYSETGGKDMEEVIDVPYQAAVEEHDEEEKILVYIPYTEAELAEKERRKEYYENKKSLAALTEDIVQDMAGELVPDMAERREEFLRLHAAVREYEGKEARARKEDIL